MVVAIIVLGGAVIWSRWFVCCVYTEQQLYFSEISTLGNIFILRTKGCLWFFIYKI